MLETIKNILRSILPETVKKNLQNYTAWKEWERKGRPSPPPHIVKQHTIAEYQQRFALDLLIETGTYTGDMIEAQKKRFKKIISIELGAELFKNATDRFKKDKNIIIVHGDSGTELSKITEIKYEPAIFWLDGHYSG